MTDECVSLGELHDAGPLPAVYCVPRAGSAARETARTRDDLYRLRGELELLRRIARLATPGRFPRTVALPGRYSEADRAELTAILRDARHPLVGAMAQLVDEEFVSIRDDMMMSALLNQAERICREATDAGVLEPAPGCDDRGLWITPAALPPPVAPQAPAGDGADPLHDELPATPAEKESAAGPQPGGQPPSTPIADAVDRLAASVQRLREVNPGSAAAP